MNITVGKIRQTPKGEWSASTAYEFLDTVTSDGSSYMCINVNGAPAGTLLSNTSYYQCIASRGAVGTTAIDDSSTSADRCWSANKVNGLIGDLETLINAL